MITVMVNLYKIVFIFAILIFYFLYFIYTFEIVNIRSYSTKSYIIIILTDVTNFI